MAQPYVGEIRMFAGNFPPAGWMFCDGQLLPISENETLFNLIGTTYGGDGQSTFALPNMQGRIPIHQGNGFVLAETIGVESVTLTTNQIPSHTHAVMASDSNGSTTNPSGAVLARNASADGYTSDTSGGLAALNAGMITPTGGSQPHDNMAPFLCINFIISLFGIFPTQT
ncbi:MAG: phage tail protein [Saprospiraceae bacterium]|nr:phage tail protein [Saprospiraceae bacterium]